MGHFGSRCEAWLIACIALTSCDYASKGSKSAETENIVPVRKLEPPTAQPAAPIQISQSEIKPKLPLRTAILCSHFDGSEREIYIIDDGKKEILFFNQVKKMIEPVCISGQSCNWNFTDNRISFDNEENGFIIGMTLNRVTGSMTAKTAFRDNQFDEKNCQKTSMPKIKSNKF